MVSALVERYKITGEAEILEAAFQSYNFLNSELLADEDKDLLKLSGRTDDSTLFEYTILYHFHTNGEGQGSTGLLADQVDFINAALDLYEATGNVVYNYEAYEAADFILHFLEDKAEGGFFDLAPDPDAIGDLARPKKDIGENANAALAFIRLSAMNFSDPPRLRQAAERALTLFADKYADYGYFSSSYARAVEAATAPGLHVTIVGDRESAETRKLQRAAWSFVAPAKTVETLTPEDAGKRGLPADKDGRAYATVCVGTVCFAPVSDAGEIRTHLLASQGSSPKGRTQSE